MLQRWRAIIKAIIEFGYRGSAIQQARRDLALSQAGGDIDYHLIFESARTLFSELTPGRLDTLDYLRLHGPMSIYGLAKELNRNYPDVHADVKKRLEHGLVQKDADNLIPAPWDAIEIRMAKAKAASSIAGSLVWPGQSQPSPVLVWAICLLLADQHPTMRLAGKRRRTTM